MTQSSRTALGVAWLRAAHQVLDNAPLLLEDHVAPALFSADAIGLLRSSTAGLQTSGARALRSHVMLRSRFAEDRLALSVARGVRQYVILGAGYDTFSVRQPAWAASLRVIEVDQPATQADKRVRIEQAGLAVPDNVIFLPVDFEIETVAEGLGRSGVHREEPTFFSWLGVTVYLTETAIDSVLRTIQPIRWEAKSCSPLYRCGTRLLMTRASLPSPIGRRKWANLGLRTSPLRTLRANSERLAFAPSNF